ncbi:HU family DNA-binding protein [Kineococcus sp. SYSU DK003]|uniref:HU family DNA-binding protein n=1 Tax=Kineococcus sp. SYSU DK003 TaxID=3383124 RepID=UPI003D7D509D
MNRSELVTAVAQRAGLTQSDADSMLNALGDVLVEAVAKGEAVKVPGLLTVERVERAARTGRNPRTGETMEIAASFGAKLTAGSKLKAAAAGN